MTVATSAPRGTILSVRIRSLPILSAKGKIIAKAAVLKMSDQNYVNRSEKELVLACALRDKFDELTLSSDAPQPPIASLTLQEVWNVVSEYIVLGPNHRFDAYPSSNPLFGIHPPIETCNREGCDRTEIALLKTQKKLGPARGQFRVEMEDNIAQVKFYCSLCMPMEIRHAQANGDKKASTKFVTLEKACRIAERLNSRKGRKHTRTIARGTRYAARRMQRRFRSLFKG